MRALAGSLTVLPVTDAVADLYGQTRAALERRGLVKTDFDLVIACTALSLKAALVPTTKTCSTAALPIFRLRTG